VSIRANTPDAGHCFADASHTVSAYRRLTVSPLLSCQPGSAAKRAPAGRCHITGVPITVGAAATQLSTTISQKIVQLILGRLLTDEEFRIEFLRDPRSTLATMREQGPELTPGEIEALLRTERTLWADAAVRIDPRLQRASLRRD
jgi:hypothetical protein